MAASTSSASPTTSTASPSSARIPDRIERVVVDHERPAAREPVTARPGHGAGATGQDELHLGAGPRRGLDGRPCRRGAPSVRPSTGRSRGGPPAPRRGRTPARGPARTSRRSAGSTSTNTDDVRRAPDHLAALTAASRPAATRAREVVVDRAVADHDEVDRHAVAVLDRRARSPARLGDGRRSVASAARGDAGSKSQERSSRSWTRASRVTSLGVAGRLLDEGRGSGAPSRARAMPCRPAPRPAPARAAPSDRSRRVRAHHGANRPGIRRRRPPHRPGRSSAARRGSRCGTARRRR